MKQTEQFSRINQLQFKDLSLLRSALTHSTYAYEQHTRKIQDNERLEFLGDAVLQLAVSDYLYQLAGAISEGRMTKIRALVVCENTLTQVAYDLDLGRYLYLGKGEEMTGGREKASNLSNAVEAVFGAIYLDQGYEAAKKEIYRRLARYLDLAVQGKMIYDFKSRLLEMVQSTRGNSTMSFKILAEQGPVHDRTYVAAVEVDQIQVATGQGGSKKEAEQAAAKSALQILSCNSSGCVIEKSE